MTNSNDRIKATKTAVARDAIAALEGVVDGDLDAAAERATFSRHAGCTMCPCSPGVVMGSALRLNGDLVDLWVDPAQ